MTLCSRLRAKKASVDDAILPAAFSEVLQRHRVLMAVEAAEFHEPRLRRHPDDYQPCIRKLLEEGIACPAPEYARSKEHQASLQFEANQLVSFEVLICPATTTPAPETATTGDPAFNSPWSYTGLPTVSIPAGLSPDGLPLAIQLVGKRGSDESLLTVATWCEKALGVGPLTPPLPR